MNKNLLQALLLSLTIATAAMAVTFGLDVIRPSFFHWLLGGDSYNHYLGWMFYRNSPWSFPIGEITGYANPLGANVIQTDTIPWLAVVSKILSPWLPEDFQYWGLWHYLCFFLQTFFGWKISRLFTNNLVEAFFLTLLFTFAPPYLYRREHHSLAAQFFILAPMWAYFRQVLHPEKKPPTLLLLVLLVFSIGVHAYLFVMAFALTVTVYLNSAIQNSNLRIRHSVELAGIFVACVVSAWVLGYFGIKDVGDVGFGGYSADVLTFINPQGLARIFPRLRRGWGQYEGFAYLGAGIALLAVFYLPKFWKTRSERKLLRLLFYVSLAMFIFAMGTPLTFGGNPIIYVDMIYQPFEKITGALRATGRFTWPLFYFIYVNVIWMLYKSTAGNKRTLVVLSLCAVQLFDLSNMIQGMQRQLFPVARNAEYWGRLGERSHLILVPPRLIKGSYDCSRDGFDPDDVKHFAFLAAKMNWTYNSGFIGRASPRLFEICENFWSDLERMLSDNKNLFVIHSKYQEQFNSTLKKTNQKLDCSTVEGFHVCVANEIKE